eukprot:1205155-Rhodomonas_salina.2
MHRFFLSGKVCASRNFLVLVLALRLEALGGLERSCVLGTARAESVLHTICTGHLSQYWTPAESVLHT